MTRQAFLLAMTKPRDFKNNIATLCAENMIIQKISSWRIWIHSAGRVKKMSVLDNFSTGITAKIEIMH